MPKEQLPSAPNRSDHGRFGRAWYAIFFGCLLGISPDPHALPRCEKNIFHHSPWTLLLQCDAFRFENVGATYQRLVTKMFRLFLGSTTEVYIDDMLVKSKQRPDHAAHLQQTFDLLREYGMKLNPLKCAFRVSAGRFLGFMLTKRGIEANPAQLKAILQSPAPISKKGIQQLTGRLATLGRFIYRFTDRLKPFFTTLRGASRAEWNEECDRAFVAIKQHLTEPPILVSPEAGDTLYLYLAASNIAVSTTLFKECGDAKLRTQWCVFYPRASSIRATLSRAGHS